MYVNLDMKNYCSRQTQTFLNVQFLMNFQTVVTVRQNISHFFKKGVMHILLLFRGVKMVYRTGRGRLNA